MDVTVEPIQYLNGKRRVLVMTSGEVGSESAAIQAARRALGKEPVLLARASQWGMLGFYFEGVTP